MPFESREILIVLLLVIVAYSCWISVIILSAVKIALCILFIFLICCTCCICADLLYFNLEEKKLINFTTIKCIFFFSYRE